jgi:hypothetical protein
MQIFLNERDIIAFEDNRPVHLVDARVASFLCSAFDESSQILLKLPNVALNSANQCGALEASESHFYVDRQHKVFGALDEIGKLEVEFWIWWAPT